MQFYLVNKNCLSIQSMWLNTNLSLSKSWRVETEASSTSPNLSPCKGNVKPALKHTFQFLDPWLQRTEWLSLERLAPQQSAPVGYCKQWRRGTRETWEEGDSWTTLNAWIALLSKRTMNDLDFIWEACCNHSSFNVASYCGPFKLKSSPLQAPAHWEQDSICVELLADLC